MKLLLFCLVVITASTANAIFEKGEHCVAWKTRKTMGLFKTVNPVGKNCAIQTKIVKTDDGGFRFEGAFPINRFNSGEKDRDQEVVKILDGQKQMMIVFETQAMSKAEWQKIMALGGGNIKGELKMAGRNIAISPKIDVVREGQSYVFSGNLISDFNQFKVKPPKIALGLVAKVHDYLELHYQFQAKEIDGLKKLFAP